MDWESVLVSAGLSAIVSAVVALVVSLSSAGVVVKLQKRAERAEEARRELRDLLAPRLRHLRQYRAGIRATMGRKGNRAESSDAVLAGEVLDITDDLAPWRRWLVRRRLRKVLGPVWLDLAELHTPGDAADAFNVLLAQQIDAIRRERRGEAVERTDDLGLMHRALTGRASSKDLDRLESHLRRLAAGW